MTLQGGVGAVRRHGRRNNTMLELLRLAFHMPDDFPGANPSPVLVIILKIPI
jgi:hypothetical protein